MDDNKPDINDEPENEFQDRIQRTLNESKKQELRDKYGMEFKLTKMVAFTFQSLNSAYKTSTIGYLW